MGDRTAPALLRYWGSYFKTKIQGENFAAVFRPAAERGWNTFLVCSQAPQDPSWLKPFKKLGTRIVYLPRAGGNLDLGCVARTFLLCRRIGCTVFLCDNLHTSPMIGAALARVPVRFWFKRSMQPCFEGGRSPGLRDRLIPSVRLTCRLGTRTLCVSQSVRDELIGFGIPSAKLQVFPNPIPPFSPLGESREESRRRFGYGDDQVVICAVGQAVPVKGWDLLVNAFSELAHSAPQTRLLLAGSFQDPGERSFYRELEALIERSGVRDKVRFTGHLADIRPVLAGSDIFVSPSRSEGFSYALVEALAAGLPCVAARVGIAPEVIEDGINGFLVDRGQTGQFTAALLNLVIQPEFRRAVSQRVRTRKPGWSLEEYSQKLFDLSVSLLSEKGGN